MTQSVQGCSILSLIQTKKKLKNLYEWLQIVLLEMY